MSTRVDSAIRGALAEVAVSAGLEVHESFDPSALGATPGPFITMDIDGPGGNLGRCVAVRDAMSPDGEQLLRALVRAVAGDQPAQQGVPAGDGTELLARFESPVDVVALSDGREVQAVVVSALERRLDGGGAGLGGAAPAGRAEPAAGLTGGFDKLSNVGLDVSVELGRARVTLADVLAFDVGSVVELDRAAGAPVDVRVNGTLLAQGEVVLVDDEYAVRITAIIDPRAER